MTAPVSTRREFLLQSALAGGGLLAGRRAFGAEAPASPSTDGKALIAITLDMEMSANYPRHEDTHWNYEKGNLNDETKRYCVEAARGVKARGGRIHFFCVGRVLEQENVDWLKEIVREGHPVGNHTYDHIDLRATKAKDLQFRFRAAPWLVEGKTAAEVMRENIRMTTEALKTRIGIAPAGFRTPGGFAPGLDERPDLQKMLVELGFDWISCKSPKTLQAGMKPTRATMDAIVKDQVLAQPYRYPNGLIEVPMNPVSDVNSVRAARWKREDFLTAVRLGIEWAIENRACYDLLSHPSCLYVVDPDFKLVDMVCDLVQKAGDRAALVDLGTMARRAPAAPAVALA